MSRARYTLLLALLCVLTLIPAARASGPSTGPTSPPPPELPTDRPLTPAEQEAFARQEAEESYTSGRKELEKADREWQEALELARDSSAQGVEKARKKRESASKRYEKSAERFREATARWPEHADAWNLLGYSLRRSGRLEEAFDAYWRCLKLKPDHAGAHEYLGEAWLASGRLDQAQGELAWLRGRGAPEAEALDAAIRRYLEANPGAQAAADSTRRALGIDTPGAGAAAPR